MVDLVFETGSVAEHGKRLRLVLLIVPAHAPPPGDHGSDQAPTKEETFQTSGDGLPNGTQPCLAEKTSHMPEMQPRSRKTEG